jgi:hypothetical protein
MSDGENKGVANYRVKDTKLRLLYLKVDTNVMIQVSVIQ